MAQASRTETLPIDMETFYKVVTDYESYSDFVDGVSEVKILEQGKTKLVVEYSLNLIKTFHYTLKTKQEMKAKSAKVNWKLVESDLMKVNNGSWTLKAISEEETEVTYDIEVEFKGFVPKMVINKLVEGNLPGLFKSYLKRAKAIHGKKKK